MSLRAGTVGLGGIVGVAFLLAAPAGADDEQRGRGIASGRGVVVRVEAADPGAAAGVEDPARKTKLVPVQGMARQSAPAASAAEARPWPHVTVRDLRTLHGFYVLDDERETFDRFLRWRGRVLDQGFSPAGHYYYFDYGARRSSADDYIRLSEYERLRRERDRNRREMEVRKVRLLTQHEKALEAGLQRLKAGQTERAIVAFTLAAKLNQADPACRIHLAQARVAQGHYLEAGLALRRALQLQPRLVYADLHLKQHYAAEDALDKHTAALSEWVQQNPARPEVYFLLGFLEFQRGDFEAAHAAFERVKEAMPDDDLTREYLEVTKPAAPQQP